MGIIMGKGCLEAIHGLMGLKGLKLGKQDLLHVLSHQETQ